MRPDDLDHEILIRRLIESIRCTECGSAYAARDVHVVAQDNDTWTLEAQCPVCGMESIVLAYMDDDSDPDLAPPDSAEVAAWRRFLAHFHGDLRDLLRK